MAESSRENLKRKKGKTLVEVSVFYRSNHSRAKFIERTSNREVGAERVWDYNFLKNNVKFSYLEKFEEWGWWPLLASSRDILTDVAKVFYFFGNETEYNDKGKKMGLFKDSFVTKVFDVQIEITVKKINKMLGIKHVSRPKSIPHDFNFVEACRVVYDDPRITEFVGKVRKLNVRNRILHLMFSHTLIPKKGGMRTFPRKKIFGCIKSL